MAAPSGPSMYSYSRVTWGSSSEPSVIASDRNISATSASPQVPERRYLIATGVPVTSCRASTTDPNPPEPSSFSSV